MALLGDQSGTWSPFCPWDTLAAFVPVPVNINKAGAGGSGAARNGYYGR